MPEFDTDESMKDIDYDDIMSDSDVSDIEDGDSRTTPAASEASSRKNNKSPKQEGHEYSTIKW